MRYWWNKIGRWLFALIALLIAVGVLFGLTSGAGFIGAVFGGFAPRTYRLDVTLVAPPVATPLADIEQVSPLLVQALDDEPPAYASLNDRFFNLDVQPLGVYLPRSGNRQFALIEPTPYPTAYPYPTSPPRPTSLPTLVPTVTPPLMPTLPAVSPTPVTMAMTDCAPSGLPVEGIFTQRYHRYHPAIDIGVPVGTPVRTTHSGIVIYADWSPIGYGYLVIVQSGPFITYYAHNNAFNVVVGQMVQKGQVLSWSGNTGNSTGPHVHYETRVNDVTVDPLTFERRGYGSC